MNQPWTPESGILITDEGMVILIKLDGVVLTSLAATFEKGVLCVSGQHEDFGKFESRFEIPANHNPIKATIDLEIRVLRIQVRTGKKDKEIMLGPVPIPINISGTLPIPSKIEVSRQFSAPHPMMIYCNGCGKHFDIIATKEKQDHPCPHCGKIHAFSLETLINQALEQSQKMLRKKRGSR